MSEVVKGLVNDGKLVVELIGRVDTSNAAGVGDEIKELIAGNEALPFVLDLDKLDYISSAGLRVLLMLKQMNDAIKLVKVSDEIYDIFDITGFADIFDIERK